MDLGLLAQAIFSSVLGELVLFMHVTGTGIVFTCIQLWHPPATRPP